MKSNTINDIIVRLKLLTQTQQNKELAQKLGIPPVTLATWKKRGKIDISRVLKVFPDLDCTWLLTGKSGTIPDTINAKEFVKIEYGGGMRLPVVLIPQKAQAGYLSNFEVGYDESELQIMRFNNYHDGQRYRCFEIAGESMQPTLLEGDYVLCERCERDLTTSANNLYVIRTKESLLCKRLKICGKKAELHSDNEAYYPIQTIDKKDLSEIWRVISLYRNFK